MKITLRGFRENKKLSDETRAFACDVLIDGRAAFRAENRGQGGCNTYFPLKDGTWDDITAATEYAKQVLNADFEPLDEFLNRMFDRITCNKKNGAILKKELKTGGAVILHNQELRVSKTPWNPANTALIQSIGKTFPGGIILNALPFDEAVEKMTDISLQPFAAAH